MKLTSSAMLPIAIGSRPLASFLAHLDDAIFDLEAAEDPSKIRQGFVSAESTLATIRLDLISAERKLAYLKEAADARITALELKSAPERPDSPTELREFLELLDIPIDSVTPPSSPRAAAVEAHPELSRQAALLLARVECSDLDQLKSRRNMLKLLHTKLELSLLKDLPAEIASRVSDAIRRLDFKFKACRGKLRQMQSSTVGGGMFDRTSNHVEWTVILDIQLGILGGAALNTADLMIIGELEAIKYVVDWKPAMKTTRELVMKREMLLELVTRTQMTMLATLARHPVIVDADPCVTLKRILESKELFATGRMIISWRRQLSAIRSRLPPESAEAAFTINSKLSHPNALAHMRSKIYDTRALGPKLTALLTLLQEEAPVLSEEVEGILKSLAVRRAQLKAAAAAEPSDREQLLGRDMPVSRLDAIIATLDLYSRWALDAYFINIDSQEEPDEPEAKLLHLWHASLTGLRGSTDSLEVVALLQLVDQMDVLNLNPHEFVIDGISRAKDAVFSRELVDGWLDELTRLIADEVMMDAQLKRKARLLHSLLQNETAVERMRIKVKSTDGLDAKLDYAEFLFDTADGELTPGIEAMLGNLIMWKDIQNATRIHLLLKRLVWIHRPIEAKALGKSGNLSQYIASVFGEDQAGPVMAWLCEAKAADGLEA
jgi:hypothetical protein